MTVRHLVDTGPLVALLNPRDSHHEWARRALDAIEPPLHTCESVISEATFLLRKYPNGAHAVLRLIEGEVVVVSFDLQSERGAVAKLMLRYQNVPMSLANACLVRMAELHPDATLITLDSDFRVHRINGRRSPRLLSPV